MAESFTVVLQGLYLDPEVPLALYLADVAINAVFSVITIIGNVLIMAALRKIPLTQVHTIFKLFLFNLALADLGVGVIVHRARAASFRLGGLKGGRVSVTQPGGSEGLLPRKSLILIPLK